MSRRVPRSYVVEEGSVDGGGFEATYTEEQFSGGNSYSNYSESDDGYHELYHQHPTTTTTNGWNGHHEEEEEDKLSPRSAVHAATTTMVGCAPYKRDKLHQVMRDAPTHGQTPSEALLETLHEMNVECYVLDASHNLLQEMIRVVEQVVSCRAAACRRQRQRQPPLNARMGRPQQCLLYRDHEQRLYNLVLTSHAVGPASQWLSLLETFSGLQAMTAVMVLVRSLSCIVENNNNDNDNNNTQPQFRPAYLSLVLGLALGEEISLAWLTASMLVRSTPSMAAYSLTSRVGSDWLRKAMLLCLSLAGAAASPGSQWQRTLTLTGVGLAVALLLSNLGSRAWSFLQWTPLTYNGPLAPLVAFGASMGAGFMVPYMGHREIQAGGQRALESVLTTGLLAAIVFVLSDYDQVQRFLVVGSEVCICIVVVVVVVEWWTISQMCCSLSLFSETDVSTGLCQCWCGYLVDSNIVVGHGVGGTVGTLASLSGRRRTRVGRKPSLPGGVSSIAASRLCGGPQRLETGHALLSVGACQTGLG